MLQKVSRAIIAQNFADLPINNTIIMLKSCSTLLLAALLAAGCKSTPPIKVDAGPIEAKSFSFIDGGVRPDAPDFADRRAALHEAIQNAITGDLATKGLKKLTSGGDVIVAYLVIIGNNATTESIDKYFGYGRNAAGLQDRAQAAYTGVNNPNRFEAGTLLVDVLDGQSYKLLHRSFVVRPLLRNTTAEVREERIQEAVAAVLQDVKFTN